MKRNAFFPRMCVCLYSSCYFPLGHWVFLESPLFSQLIHLYTHSLHPFTYFSEIIPLLEIIAKIMKRDVLEMGYLGLIV